jgi:hypothetical protein
MIIEMRTYDIQVGKLNEFINIYDNDIREIHTSILGNQLGFFYTEIGSLNQVIHLYGYDTYEDRERRRKVLSKNESFLKYIVKVKGLILSQTNQLLNPTSFSKIR